jgi:hypothetical protein
MQQKSPKKHKKKRKNNNINNTNIEHQQLAEKHRKPTIVAEEAYMTHTRQQVRSTSLRV